MPDDLDFIIDGNCMHVVCVSRLPLDTQSLYMCVVSPHIGLFHVLVYGLGLLLYQLHVQNKTNYTRFMNIMLETV